MYKLVINDPGTRRTRTPTTTRTTSRRRSPWTSGPARRRSSTRRWTRSRAPAASSRTDAELQLAEPSEGLATGHDRALLRTPPVTPRRQIVIRGVDFRSFGTGAGRSGDAERPARAAADGPSPADTSHRSSTATPAGSSAGPIAGSCSRSHDGALGSRRAQQLDDTTAAAATTTINGLTLPRPRPAARREPAGRQRRRRRPPTHDDPGRDRRGGAGQLSSSCPGVYRENVLLWKPAQAPGPRPRRPRRHPRARGRRDDPRFNVPGSVIDGRYFRDNPERTGTPRWRPPRRWPLRRQPARAGGAASPSSRRRPLHPAARPAAIDGFGFDAGHGAAPAASTSTPRRTLRSPTTSSSATAASPAAASASASRTSPTTRTTTS